MGIGSEQALEKSANGGQRVLGVDVVENPLGECREVGLVQGRDWCPVVSGGHDGFEDESEAGHGEERVRVTGVREYGEWCKGKSRRGCAGRNIQYVREWGIRGVLK